MLLYSLLHLLGAITSIPLKGFPIKSFTVTTDCADFEWQVLANCKMSLEDIGIGTIWYPDMDIPAKYSMKWERMSYLSFLEKNIRIF